MKNSFELQVEAGCRRLTAPCLIILLLALVLWPGSAFAQDNSGTLLTTFTNPAPALDDVFVTPRPDSCCSKTPI